MEKKSYPEILHNICVEFGHGERSRVDAFEKAIVLLIDQIITDKKNKLLPNENIQKNEQNLKNDNIKNEHYLKNDNIINDCDSCSRHDIIVGCTLKHKNKCIVDEKRTKYRRAHLLPCDRCKTYSVVTKIDRIPDNNKDSIPRPAIKFMCLKCKDYPLINKGIFKGYELRGMEFTEKYIRMYKQKEQREQKIEQAQDVQQKDSVQDIQQKDSIQDIQQKVSAQDIQQKDSVQDIQAESEIEIVAISG